MMFLNKTLEEVEQLPFVDKDDICPEFWDDVQKTTDEFLTGYPYISNESITNLQEALADLVIEYTDYGLITFKVFITIIFSLQECSVQIIMRKKDANS